MAYAGRFKDEVQRELLQLQVYQVYANTLAAKEAKSHQIKVGHLHQVTTAEELKCSPATYCKAAFVQWITKLCGWESGGRPGWVRGGIGGRFPEMLVATGFTSVELSLNLGTAFGTWAVYKAVK